MVAAVHNSGELALCRPRDKSWSVYQVFEENENLVKRVNRILFSSTGVLYALVTGSRNGGGVDADRTLKFGDEAVKLKLIYDIEEWWIDAGVDPVGLLCMSYLLESTNNEILLIHQILRMDVDEDDEEFMEGHEDNEDSNNNEEEEGDDNNMEDNEEHESILEWAGQILLGVYAKAKQLNPDFNIDKEDPKTICFRVYKIDPDNNYYHKVENLGDQIFFVAEDGSSLSP
ncbi:hypothetical protein RchiOBHm_Chr6g0280611 [Rosa chinensis]|uniref:KIB1-4 beta-propeller domain-containing protein n=1 Tax=Rosa chinensis TaxID=74649 RepID=A0A2P6PT97_ROSCH|nr:hypothetical protein RchiOBHm_Chr6g0280611 [Rosa chinensis]